MQLKKVNYAILVLIFILSLLLVYVLLKAIFFGNEKIEWGSVSDWISSLSTFFTLVVAFKAYRAAPNWLNQKLDESALSQATEIISRDLYRYRKLIEKPYNEIANYVTLRDLADEDQDPYLIDFIQGYKELDNTINEISELGIKIEGDFIALHKMGWVLEEEAYDKYKKLDASTNNLYSNYINLKRLISIYEKLIIENQENNAHVIKEKIVKTSELSFEKYQKFSDDFQCFFHYSDHIPVYFEGKH